MSRKTAGHCLAAAWTPVKVRREKLGLEGNLGLSPKSLKMSKVCKNFKPKKIKPEGGRVLGIKTLLEGASPLKTKAYSTSNRCRTNLLAVKDRIAGQVYQGGELYSGERRDWTGKQAVGRASQDSANREMDTPHPGLGEGGGGGSKPGTK